jgi:integrase
MVIRDMESLSSPGFQHVNKAVRASAGSRSAQRKVWTVDDARMVLEPSLVANDPLHAGYVLLLVLGLRRGELLGLRWADLDLRSAEARVSWQLLRINGHLALRPTKTVSSEAVLPLPGICVRALS